jgi:hypothetical protein
MRKFVAKIIRRLLPPSEIIEGYEQPELVNAILMKTKAYNPAPDELLEIGGVSTVLDFGGGAGIDYRQARSETVRWAVVESAGMVERASELETERLRFFTAISEAAEWLGEVDLMHSNGALQYVPEPLHTLDQLCGLKAKQMLWKRVLLSSSSLEREVQSSFLGDNGPGSLPVLREKIIKYDRTRIPEPDFVARHRDYYLADRGPDWFRFSLKEMYGDSAIGKSSSR